MKLLSLFAMCLFFGFNANAQDKLEVAGAIVLSDSEGTPKDGTIRFNTTSNDFEGFYDGRWNSLSGRFTGDGGIFSGLICFNGLIADLVDLDPDTDIDGDGDVDLAAVIVFATDFMVRPDTKSTYSINYVGDAAAKNKLIIIATCQDSENTPVEIHRWNGDADVGFCETQIIVRDSNNACQN